MRVLITGGAGFIGSHIADLLIRRGDSVLVVDDLSTGSARNVPNKAELVRMNIGSAELPALAVQFKAESMVHVAAQASVARSMEDPLFDATTNILGSINVARAANDAASRRFVYITTGGALYGIPEHVPVAESHPVRPLSAYGMSKWTVEGYLNVLLPDATTRAVLRLANVYGPRQDPHGEAGVIAVFGMRMVRGEPVTIHDDGEQTRDFVYAADVAEAAVLALEAPTSLTVNIGSGVGTSINELFRLMAAACGYHHEPEYGPRRPGDVRHSVLDIRLAATLFGWRPQTSLSDGLNATLGWIAAHRASTRSE